MSVVHCSFSFKLDMAIVFDLLMIVRFHLIHVCAIGCFQHSSRETSHGILYVTNAIGIQQTCPYFTYNAMHSHVLRP